MKAILYRKYGASEVLSCEEVERPMPADDQVLIRVRAASVNPLDWHFMRGTPYAIRMMTGLRRPKDQRLGVDVAGEVDAVGKNATQFKPGDAVFGTCRGAFAQFACASHDSLTTKPENLTFESAAAVPIAGVTALQALRDRGLLQAGQKVLVNGASGGVGTFAIQIAKSFDAHVTAVCSSRNVDMVRSIGADRVVDYTQEDFTRNGQTYDLILDCIGNRPLLECARLLNRRGRYVAVGGPNGRWIGPMSLFIKAGVLSPFTGRKLGGIMARITEHDLSILGGLLADRKIIPVIDRTFGLREVPDAVAYLEQGHARGKVVISIEH